MRTLVDIDKDIAKANLMLASASEEKRRELKKWVEQLEWERLVVENERVRNE